MPRKPFSQWSALALIGGGALTLLINAVLTPALPRNVSYAASAASTVFLWRQSASALAAALLLLGAVGLYLRQAERAGRFGALAFAVALAGTALLLGTEWGEVFNVRDLAQRAPEVLNALEAANGPSLSDVGAMIALVTFVLGWTLLAISTLRSRAASPIAAWLVIAGFSATPLLHPLLPGFWSAVVGNAILGSGFAWLGYDILDGQGADRETRDG